MAEQSFVASALVMGVLLVATAVAVIRMRDWRQYRPGREGTAGEVDRTMDVVWLLLAVAVVCVGAIVYSALPLESSMLIVLGAFLALVLAAYLAWGVYHTLRTNGRKTSEAVMVGAWVVGSLALVGISVLLVLG